MTRVLHPAVVVDLEGQTDKPLACIAVVRRQLQLAGYPEAAEQFTREALAVGPEEILDAARRFVTLRE